MAVAFRAKAENSAASGTTATGNKPSGTADGDVLIAVVTSTGSATTVSGVPSGWTLVQNDPAPADFSIWTYYKIASSEGASWDWTLSASGAWRVDVLAYSGGASTGQPNTSSAEQAAGVTSLAVGAITTTVNGCMVVTVAAVDATGSARTWTEDGSPTERIESTLQNLHLLVCDETQASSGSITRTVTVSGSTQDMAGHIIAIAPATGESHSGSTVLTGGGVVVLSQTSARSRTQAITGGGVVVPAITGAHAATSVLTGGGVVVPVASGAHAATSVLTGGGIVVYTYSTGTGGEPHSGSAVLTGAGIVALTARKGALWSQALTGGGVIASVGAKQALAYAGLTGGGIVVIISGSGAEAMPDFDPITTALAGRFAAAVVTPPPGYDNVRVSTGNLPEQMTPLPSVYVFPDRGTFDTGQGTRTGDHDYFVRFYFNQTGDTERDMVALRKWLTVLVDQLKAATQLGGIVSVARVESWQLGILNYAGKTYSGIELGVHIRTDEAWAATA